MTRAPNMATMALALAILCGTGACDDGGGGGGTNQATLDGTWIRNRATDRWVLVLSVDGTTMLDHTFESVPVTSETGTWSRTGPRLDVTFVDAAAPDAGERHWEGPWELDEDELCMMECRPYGLSDDRLAMEAHMTRTDATGTLVEEDLLHVEYTLDETGDCTARRWWRTLDPDAGSDEGNLESFSCIYESTPESYVFTVVWEEGDYPDSYVLVPFGERWIEEDDLPWRWVRGS